MEKLNIKEEIKIERAHCAGPEDHKRMKPRAIVLKLLNYKDKEKVLHQAIQLKGSGIYINEDFAKETLEKRKLLWEEVKRHRAEGKYAIIRYDKVYVRAHNNMSR